MSPHTASVQSLTGTPDGGAILSVDDLGGVRLWPTVDGTQEPRVVELPAFVRFSLTRHGSGFSAVVVDESGGLYVASLDADGRTLAHTTHAGDPAFTGLAAATQGTFAWRVDQHILLLDGDGRILGQIATEPQQRIIDLAVAGSRALAILDRDGTRQARWLSFESRLAWGAWVPLAVNTELGSQLSLAPDDKHFATVDSPGLRQRVAAFEIATGKEVLAHQHNGVLGEAQFADADTLVFANQQGVSWMVLAGDQSKPPLSSGFMMAVRPQQLVATAGRVIRGHGNELVVVTQAESKYLGYATHSPRASAAGPAGGVLISANNTFRMLDRKLDVVGAPSLSTKPGSIVSELLWLGGDDWLLEGTLNATWELTLVDVKTGTSTVVRDRLPEIHTLAYEPSTELVTLSFGTASEVARFERKGRTLDRIAAAATVNAYELTLFVPLAPKLARGHQLLHATLRDKASVTWLADPRALEKASVSLVLSDAYAGADAAGHVYVWRTGQGDAHIVVLTDGNPTATLPVSGPALLWPDRDGARVLATGPNAIALYKTDGTLLWTRDVAGAQEGMWLSDGALAIIHASGIARLDASTGATTAARCGWDFELSSKPHTSGSHVEPICMQLLR